MSDTEVGRFTCPWCLDRGNHALSGHQCDEQDLFQRIESQERDIAELVEAMEVLTTMYVRNQGTDSEFITCITPRGAYSLTKVDRKADKTWKAWDKARELLAKHKGDTP